ncbi:MAG: signal transduction histidine kinase [Verrucomicrobiaceae bacterium]|nr:signal transduction histidine kinase [Verrucomicrobiaceae bacterium]
MAVKTAAPTRDGQSINNSLRGTLLHHLTLILLPTLLIGTALTYFVAVHRVRDVFDMNLLDVAHDLQRAVEVRDGRLVLDLPPAAQEMVRTANRDRISYVLWNPQQGLIGGDEDLLELDQQIEADFFASQKDRSYKFAAAHFRGRNQRFVQLVATVAGHPLYVTVAQTAGALNGIQRSIFASVFFLGILLTAVALSGVYIGVRRGLKPIAALSAAISLRSSANLTALTTAQAPHELRPIVDNINSLLERLELSLLAHRHFIADAAHQLRTPLAALSAQFEVALKIPPTDTHATLAQMYATTQRASHLANQLLSLARLEHTDQIPQTTETLTLEEILRAVLPRCVLAAESAGIELEFDTKPCRIFGNRILLEELFSNLLDNEIRYVQRGGHVKMLAQQHNETVQISLIDNGPGVPADELEKLGTAFFRADSSNHNGCGLGLAIGREIVRLHKGNMEFLGAGDQGGLRIDIQLPSA